MRLCSVPNIGVIDKARSCQAVQHLFTLLAQRRITSALAGGVALLHDVQGRHTNDVARAMFAELPVDILLARNAFFGTYIDSMPNQLRCLNKPFVTIEGLLLLKLYALCSRYRQGNMARIELCENDIATSLHDYRSDMVALFQASPASAPPY